MHKLIFTGFHHSLTEENAREFLEHIHAGTIISMKIISDGNTAHPYLIAELAIDDMQAFNITTRIKDYWYDTHHVSACALWAES